MAPGRCRGAGARRVWHLYLTRRMRDPGAGALRGPHCRGGGGRAGGASPGTCSQEPGGEMHQPSIKEGAESWSSEGRERVTVTYQGAENPKAPKGVAGCQAELWAEVWGRGRFRLAPLHPWGRIGRHSHCHLGDEEAGAQRPRGRARLALCFGNGAGVLKSRIWADSQARVVRTGDKAELGPRRTPRPTLG